VPNVIRPAQCRICSLQAVVDGPNLPDGWREVMRQTGAGQVLEAILCPRCGAEYDEILAHSEIGVQIP